MASESKTAVFAAIAGNFAIAVMKFTAAAFTGSSAMLSEGIHSLVDTGNGGLLLLGINRSKQPPDEMHPFGYGKELYFWALIVAVLIFGVGGGISIYEGIMHLIHPVPLHDPTWNYVVLGLALLFEGIVFVVALREFQALKKEEENIWQAIKSSKDPTTFTVLFEDSAAMLGLIVAFVGVFLAHYFNNPYIDGAASIVIGAILCTVAGFLVYESKGLLVGEGADPKMLEEIKTLLRAETGVKRVIKPLTMHFGPRTILLTVDIEFDKRLSALEVEEAVDRLEKSIRQKFPDIKHIYIEAGAVSAVSRENVSQSQRKGDEEKFENAAQDN